ncbi:MAG TPA: acetyl-CoA C-acetyltransferase [Candidatus Brocadiia bacterium]|nr:acetyl-CoA C-acetyltransferase [Candidatus Brocadiales bacterium]
MKNVVIASAVRTPIGSFNGSLSSIPATKLGSIVIKEAIKRAGIKATEVEQVIMGNVLTAGLGQAPARQAAIGAGLPLSVNALTINKVCGSGLKAVMLAAQAIMTGDAEVIVAGGMESMSRAPYLLEQARTGYRLGDGQIIDSMIKDGLWDVYNNFHMGTAAEIIADKYNLSREALDELALKSYERALNAQKNGGFKEEIIAVEVPQRKGKPIVVNEDEEPKKLDREKMLKLTSSFKEGGKITPANSSSISDGAAALVVMSEDKAIRLRRMGVKPMARIIGQAEFALEPELFSIAPVWAIKEVLEKTGLLISDIDLFEINEAFASTILAIQKELGLDLSKVNVKGGAIALGHPIGASGARILTTLLYAMKHRKAKRGIASPCIGGGEAVAIVVEMM